MVDKVTYLFPDWLRRMLLWLDMDPIQAQRRYNELHHETMELVHILEKLYDRNLLQLALQNAPFEPGDELFVRGVCFKVLYVKNRRLELVLPPGKRFVKKDKWR